MSPYPVSPETIRKALAHIPPEDRDLWVRMGMAVRAELGDEGFTVWDEWGQGADNYRPADAKAVWRSLKGGGVGIGTLIYEAKQRGYQPNGDARRMDAGEIERHKAERAEALRKLAEEERRANERASKLAEEIYKAAQPATDDHPYLKRKGISAAPGVRVGRWYQVNDDGQRYREKENCLLIPMRDSFGRLWNLQAIFPETDPSIERDKDYLAGGRKQGTYFAIGKPEGALAIGEGYATMQSVRAATGLAVCVAFDKGNLLPVAKSLRGKFKFANLILAADNDIKEGKPNYGLISATEAAKAVSAAVAVPELEGRKADFNDLAQAKGNDAVKAAIDRAQAPASPTAPAPINTTVTLVRGSDIKPEPIRWVWKDWLARGKFHIKAGAAGTGKTTLALSLAATVTVGGLLPDGSRAEVGNVLIWSGEDDPTDTLAPRLIACGADMSRVHFLGSVLQLDGRRRPFDPSKDIEPLRDALAAYGEVALLIVDPVVNAVSGDGNSNPEVRRSLQPLVDLGAAMGCAVLGISHFSKGTAGKDPLERLNGSVAFGALPRVVMAAAKRQEEDGGGRILLRVKSNIGPDSGGFQYDLAQQELKDHPGIFASTVLWGQAIEGSARDILATVETMEDGDERAGAAEAADLLKELLSAGPLTAKEASGKLSQSGYTPKQIRRAREKAGVISDKQGFGANACTVWKLPEGSHTCPPSPYLPIDAHSKERASRASMGKYEAPVEDPKGDGGEFEV